MTASEHILEDLGIVPVHVTNPPGEAKKCFYRSTHRTIVLSATNQFLPLISGPDPSRCELIVVAIDAVAVVGPFAEIDSPDNVVTGLPSPRGTIIPIGQPIAFRSMSDLWVATPLTGVNVNRIGIISVHEVPELQ